MIDILMATYNGEKFLDTQISSIVNQTVKEWKLYIHDDGSNDNTVEKIKNWCAKDSRILFVDDGISYHNSGMNFLNLIKKSTSEYICFSDQDDYWLDNKLEKMLMAFPKNISTPHLLCSAAYLWNSEKNLITYDRTFRCPTKIDQIFFRNGGLQGCTIMFNKSFVKLVCENNAYNYNMHDLLITLIAFTLGTVSYIEEGLFIYRNHTNTVTVHPANSTIEHINTSLLKSKNTVVSKAAYDDIKCFYEMYKNVMNENKRKVFSLYLKLPEMKPISRFFRILLSNFSLNENGKLKLIIKLILRKYKDF